MKPFHCIVWYDGSDGREWVVDIYDFMPQDGGVIIMSSFKTEGAATRAANRLAKRLGITIRITKGHEA